MDRSVFVEHEFTSAEVTDRPDPSTSQVLTDDIVLSTSFVSTDKFGTFNNMPECSVSCLSLRYEEKLLILQFLTILMIEISVL